MEKEFTVNSKNKKMDTKKIDLKKVFAGSLIIYTLLFGIVFAIMNKGIPEEGILKFTLKSVIFGIIMAAFSTYREKQKREKLTNKQE